MLFPVYIKFVFVKGDFIGMQSQPDGQYKHIMTYQDHLTKFITLKALESKRAEEVAYNLLDVFCDKGAPHILQSDNGREFSNQVCSIGNMISISLSNIID